MTRSQRHLHRWIWMALAPLLLILLAAGEIAGAWDLAEAPPAALEGGR